MFPLYDESHHSHRAPIISIGLILLNALIFFSLISHCFNGEFDFTAIFNCFGDIFEKFGMIPENIVNGRSVGTIFSSMFLHGGFLHLIGNMWFLWIFGDNLEATMGKLRFITFYLLCGFLSGFLYCFLVYNKTIPVVGASGAISGMLGGYLLLFPKNKVKTLVPFGFFLTTVSIPAVVFLIVWLLYQFLLPDQGVATGAHIIGFLAGIVLVKFFKKK